MTTSVVDFRLGTIVRAFAGSTAAWLAPWLEGRAWLHVAAKTWIVACGACAVFFGLRLHRPARPGSGGSSAASRDGVRRRLIGAASLLALCHLSVLLVARVFTSSVEFSARTFAPIDYLFTVLGVAALGIAWSTSSRVARSRSPERSCGSSVA